MPTETITRALVPAAGFGTRMLPAAKAVPKELLPVLDRPVIQYVAEEALDAGIDDLLLITSREKRAIEDHFDRHAELEDRLRASGKENLLASITQLAARLRVHSVRQSEQLGLGHAVLQGRHHIGDRPFLCLLGDTIFSGGDQLPGRQLIEAYNRLGTSIIGLEEVPEEKVGRYGIVGGRFIEDGVLKIDTLVEKPSPADAPSRLAIAARYVLSPRIFEHLARTQRGAGGEIQLTDALRSLAQAEPMHGVVLKARRHDIGNPVDWLRTNLLLASGDPALWKQLEPELRRLLAR